jgi:hypothetical protein
MKMIVKFVIAVLLITGISPAFANQEPTYNIRIEFADGVNHTYKNVRHSTTIPQLVAVMQKDFPQYNLMSELVAMDATPGNSVAIKQVEYVKKAVESGEANQPGWWDRWGKDTVMALAFAAAIYYGAGLLMKGGAVKKNPCDYTWQRASDGSICGGRAAIVRSGGRF